MTAKKRTVTRKATIDGRAVVVLDDLVSGAQLAALHEALENAQFRRSEHARPDTREIRHWAADLRDVGAAVCDPFLNVSAEQVERFFGGGRRPDRAYCNVALYGDMLFSHKDSRPEDDLVTALWYVCTEWNVEWGGETLFFDESSDAAFVVSPRPGRLVLFDGALRHAGRPPNRICHAARYSMAMKFKAETRPSARGGARKSRG